MIRPVSSIRIRRNREKVAVATCEPPHLPQRAARNNDNRPHSAVGLPTPILPPCSPPPASPLTAPCTVSCRLYCCVYCNTDSITTHIAHPQTPPSPSSPPTPLLLRSSPRLLIPHPRTHAPTHSPTHTPTHPPPQPTTHRLRTPECAPGAARHPP